MGATESTPDPYEDENDSIFINKDDTEDGRELEKDDKTHQTSPEGRKYLF